MSGDARVVPLVSMRPSRTKAKSDEYVVSEVSDGLHVGGMVASLAGALGFDAASPPALCTGAQSWPANVMLRAAFISPSLSSCERVMQRALEDPLANTQTANFLEASDVLSFAVPITGFLWGNKFTLRARCASATTALYAARVHGARFAQVRITATVPGGAAPIVQLELTLRDVRVASITEAADAVGRSPLDASGCDVPECSVRLTYTSLCYRYVPRYDDGCFGPVVTGVNEPLPD